MTADYHYRGDPDWNPAAALPAGEVPRLTSRQIADLTGASRKTVLGWSRKPGFPRSPDRRRAWPEEGVRAWLASRNLLRDKISAE